MEELAWDRDDAGKIKVVTASGFNALVTGGIVLPRFELVAGLDKDQRQDLQLAMTPKQCDLVIERLIQVRNIANQQPDMRKQ